MNSAVDDAENGLWSFWGMKKTRRVERVASRELVVVRESLEDDDGEM